MSPEIIDCVDIQTRTERFFNCLSCGQGDFEVHHLIDGELTTWGTWFCDDCGEGHRGVAGNGVVSAELTGTRVDHPAVLLKLNPEAGDVYLIVRGHYWPGHNNGAPMPEKPFTDKGQRYYYDEGTCPTNYLKDVITIMHTGKYPSADPHGVFEYVRSVAMPDEEAFESGGGDGLAEVAEKLALFGEVP